MNIAQIVGFFVCLFDFFLLIKELSDENLTAK